MRYADSRRLTGPGFFLERPGAGLEVYALEAAADEVAAAWQAEARTLLEALGWDRTSLHVRRFRDGLSLALTAPPDALFTATEVNEAALWRAAAALGEPLDGDPLPDCSDFAATVERLRATWDAEANPALLDVLDAAAARGLSCLPDEDHVSVGLGRGSVTFPVREIPDAVPWERLSNIPFAEVTGTNGKSSTVRLAASILEAAGRIPAITSTDYVRIGHDVLDTGDYSGPGGARLALRDPRPDCAVLEVARGGILRRGLAVTGAEAVVVTNVAADHLGEYGIYTVDEMAGVKFAIRRALKPGGVLIANADDAPSVREVEALREAGEALPALAWFSLDPSNPVLLGHLLGGGWAVTVQEGLVGLATMCRARPPIVTGMSSARHMVANALAATALCHAMGVAPDALAAGLVALQADRVGNPGRTNLYDVGGVQVLTDYAHNAHGLKALVGTAARIPASRRLIMFGTAGDRTDDEIEALARAAAMLGADRYLIVEVPQHRRGRPEGSLIAVSRRALLGAGIPDDRITGVEGTMPGVNMALAWAQPGDLLLLILLSQREAVQSRLLGEAVPPADDAETA